MSNHLYCKKCAERWNYPTDTDIRPVGRCTICGMGSTDGLYEGEWDGAQMIGVISEPAAKPSMTETRELVQKRMREMDAL